jgi:hypothetical protein
VALTVRGQPCPRCGFLLLGVRFAPGTLRIAALFWVGDRPLFGSLRGRLLLTFLGSFLGRVVTLPRELAIAVLDKPLLFVGVQLVEVAEPVALFVLQALGSSFRCFAAQGFPLPLASLRESASPLLGRLVHAG